MRKTGGANIGRSDGGLAPSGATPSTYDFDGPGKARTPRCARCTMSMEVKLARHAATVRYEDLPEKAMDAARREVLWVLGISVAGAGAIGSEKVLSVVQELRGGCSGDATVIGYGERAPAPLAGFANGAYAKAVEYEDKHWFGNTCAYAIGVAVVPAAFAIAEHLGGVSGKALLNAVAVATDVQARLVNGAPNAINTPFNSTSMFSHFGAAIAAGKLLGLTESQMLNALGIAYTQAAGNYQAIYEGSLAFRMQIGFGVRNGIFAALMAKAGIDGPHQFLTGRSGLYPTFFKECAQEAILKDLGAMFWGARLGFKGYPCNAGMHQALDAVFQVKKAHSIRPEQVMAVDIYGTPNMANTCVPIESKRQPRNHMEQEFSLPWAVACALTEERLGLGQFQGSALGDTTKMALAQKVTGHLDPKDTQAYAVITLADGRRLTSQRVGPPTGHPDNPHSLAEMVERYRDCVTYGPKPLPRENTERAKDLALALQDVQNATEVIRLLG
ncbi:MAG: MmgE/PrpD family protein [Chloroflexi bacterium]|nr:MmgE/PrpD family protein [Chloroflexota bacterium]